MVDCQVANDKSEFLFNFDQPFEIHDDVEVLKRLGLAHGLERGEMSQEVTDNIKKNLPPSLRDFVDQIMKGSYFLLIQPIFSSGQVEIQRDQEKQVHYSVPSVGLADTKPVPLLPTAAARAPVVIARTVPGSKYQLVKPINGHVGLGQFEVQCSIRLQIEYHPVLRWSGRNREELLFLSTTSLIR